MQKLKFLVALVALFVSATAFAKIAGTYVLEMEGGQDRGGETTLTFAVDDEGTYSATMASDWGENEGSDVKVDGNEFSFSTTMETQGGDFTLSWSGTVEDGEMSGTMSTEAFEMSFTGKLKDEEEEEGEEGEDADDSAEDEPEA